MRITIRHLTHYTYAHPAVSALQLLRLTPRSHGAQFVRRWRVSIDADARLDKSEDAYGNITHFVFVDGPVSALEIEVVGEVDTQEAGGLVAGTVERQPLGLYLRTTRLTTPSEALRTLGRRAIAGQGGDRLAALHAVMGELHGTMRFEVGATTAETAAAEAWASGAGVCQDYAHVFVAVARTLGIPARYVAGYYLRSDTSSQEAGHAWAEAHVAGLGWVGFDPAHGVCVTDRHVRVSIGADSHEAAPVRGARIGGLDEALSVDIDVAQGRATVEG